MAERVTIQDIADALGVSRNTVSKALNNTGLLADATREKVLQMAVEMGYKHFSYVGMANSGRTESSAPAVSMGEIALFTAGPIGTSHFASPMLDKLQRELSQMGYSFTMHRIHEDEIDSLQLPIAYNKERTSGIICIEMFDKRYSDMLCRLETPILFVDSPVAGTEEPLKADIVCMDNQACIHSFIREMAQRDRREIGYIGEYMHCQSFFERYMGYRNAMYLLGLPLREEYCITGNKEGVKRPSGEEYRDYLLQKIRELKKLPEVFICANDFVALDALQAFRKLEIQVPRDVWLCGFDDSPESRIVTPPLTTIHIHSQIMGFSAMHLLASRIKEPSLNFRTIHTETNLIYRESTGD